MAKLTNKSPDYHAGARYVRNQLKKFLKHNPLCPVDQQKVVDFIRTMPKRYQSRSGGL